MFVYIVSIHTIIMALSILGGIMLVQWLAEPAPVKDPHNGNTVVFYERRAPDDKRVCIPSTEPVTSRTFPGQRWCRKAD
jgi:hypothetical protein